MTPLDIAMSIAAFACALILGWSVVRSWHSGEFGFAFPTSFLLEPIARRRSPVLFWIAVAICGLATVAAVGLSLAFLFGIGVGNIQ